MSEEIEVAGASVLVSGHMSNHMSSQIAVVAGRRRWSADPKLSILREAFGSDGSIGATCKRHAIGSGQLYTWRRRALAGDLDGLKRSAPPSFAEVDMSVSAAAMVGTGQIGIALPSGVRLTVDAAVDAGALARVMSVLGR